MSRLDKAEIAARVGKLVAEIWGIWQDKRKATADRERRIAALEARG